jgi:hypothetical protein
MNIAETSINATDASGKKKRITVIIGKPYKTEDHGACPVALKGIQPKLRDIHGLDTFHALVLAIGLVKVILRELKRSGWSFEIDPEVLWPAFDRNMSAKHKKKKILPNKALHRTRSPKRRSEP